MSEQIDQLSKMKAKIEKDRVQISHEIQDVRAATEEINRSKASAEKSNRNLRCGLKSINKGCALAVAAAAVAQLVERPPLRFLKEVQLSDLSSNPGRGIRW